MILLRRAVSAIVAFVAAVIATPAVVAVPMLPPGSAARTIPANAVDFDNTLLGQSIVFTDAMKQASGWTSDRVLSLAADGNVRALATHQIASAVVFPFADYPSGDYTLLYDGHGVLQIDPRSGTLTRATRGCAIIHVVARRGYGIRLRLIATDPHNYLRNVRFILPGFATSYQARPFYPAYLARLAGCKALRFAHWWQAPALTSLASRAPGARFMQVADRGIALEDEVALANAVHADPWFVVPVDATNADIRQMAALIRRGLDSRLHPMFEYGDAVWRPGSLRNAYATLAGRKFGLARDAQSAAVAWYSLRSLQLFTLAQEVFGSEGRRIVRVLGGPLAWPGTSGEAFDRAVLAWGDAGRFADVFAVAADGATPLQMAVTRRFVEASGLSLVAWGAIATDLTAEQAPLPAPTRTPIATPIPTLPPVVPWSTRPVLHPNLSSGFSGFSYEKKNLWYPNFMTSSNASLIRLFKNLGPTIVRFGGNSTERLQDSAGIYRPTMWMQNGAGATVNQIAPSDYFKLAGFLRAAHAQAIVAIPSHNGSTPAQMAAEALSAWSALGSNLYGFEIGNEVDALCSWSPSCMVEAQSATIKAIKSVLPHALIVGPDTANANSSGFGYLMGRLGFAYDLETAHYYVGASSSSPTISDMLASDPTQFISTLQSAIPSGHLLGARVDEAGSYYGGGYAGTSNSAASALFVLDFNFKAAIGGLDGVNWQGGNDKIRSYTPISDTGSVNSNPPYNIQSVNGEYYGMYGFAQVAAPGGVLSTRNWSSNPLFSTYLVNEPHGYAWLVINNKGSSAVRQSYDVGTFVAGAVQYVYTAPRPSSPSGMTYGGAPVAISGTWAGRSSPVLGYAGTVVSVNSLPYSATFVKMRTMTGVRDAVSQRR